MFKEICEASTFVLPRVVGICNILPGEVVEANIMTMF